MTRPFDSTPVVEVPLAAAPLALVVVQMRFPLIAMVTDQAKIAPFQEALRGQYPILRLEQQAAFSLGPDGPSVAHSQLWRLTTTDGSWSVGLASDAVSLETSAYMSRDDFLARWEKVLAALETFGPPAMYDRLGIRYVNRLGEPEGLPDLRSLVRPEIFGALSIEEPDDGKMLASLVQTHFQLSDAFMHARWGLVPANGVFAPGLDPVDEVSWILDLDVFGNAQPYDRASVVARSRSFAEMSYRFFRWAVTEEFLTRFGGQQ